MAKKAAAGNKSQAIRDALAAHPDKSPKEIADLLSEQGFKLNAQYVSTIKRLFMFKGVIFARFAGARRRAGFLSAVRASRPLLPGAALRSPLSAPRPSANFPLGPALSMAGERSST